MIKKLISISLIAAAALMTVAIPSAHGGPYSSYNTTWTTRCTGTLTGTLNLINKLGVSLGNPVAGCSWNGTTNTANTDTINTPVAPASWTWTSPGCLNIRYKPIISGKFGQWVPYNCFSTVPDSKGFYPLISTGSVMVSKPVGQ